MLRILRVLLVAVAVVATGFVSPAGADGDPINLSFVSSASSRESALAASAAATPVVGEQFHEGIAKAQADARATTVEVLSHADAAALAARAPAPHGTVLTVSAVKTASGSGVLQYTQLPDGTVRLKTFVFNDVGAAVEVARADATMAASGIVTHLSLPTAGYSATYGPMAAEARATCDQTCTQANAAAGISAGVICGGALLVAGVGSGAIPVTGGISLGPVAVGLVGVGVCAVLGVGVGTAVSTICYSDFTGNCREQAIVTIKGYCTTAYTCDIRGTLQSGEARSNVGVDLYFLKSEHNFSFNTYLIPLRQVNQVGGRKFYEFSATLRGGPDSFARCAPNYRVYGYTQNLGGGGYPAIDGGPKPIEGLC